MRLPKPRRIVIIALIIAALSYFPFEQIIGSEDCPLWLHAALAQESQRLTIQSDRDGNFKTYVMNADGTEPIVLKKDSKEESDSDGDIDTTIVSLMSPDGVHAALSNDGLWLTDRSLTKQRLLVDPRVRVTGYSWSPNGRFLAYA
ncbi:MAG TPA: hypothetical protein VHD90_05795, partial [Phototrophicaceae bacterium]|nr:hypothetical protein [Phototrophicaceae bacterium]